MRRYGPAFVAMTLFASLALPTLASAGAAVPYPAEPANAVAVTTDPGSLGLGLTNTAVTAATEAMQSAGFVPVANAASATAPAFTPFGPIRPQGPAAGAACVPTVALSPIPRRCRGCSPRRMYGLSLLRLAACRQLW